DVSTSSEPMLLLPKRTYQPSHIRRKRTHGFFARYISLPFSILTACSLFILTIPERNTDMEGSALFLHSTLVRTVQGNQRWQESHCEENSQGTAKNHSLAISSF
ncbi:Ribosomal protein L34, partial [Dillenia turbinata]